MAETQGVWGIDIGQAGLKAIRLRYAEAADQVLAVAFDYVPHPKILSQPDAVPEELIAQALETFLSRNDVKGDKIAISLPGQSALARFIQLPPVESSKVKEIVKFEARQQIPFALEEVIWDYQTIGSGVEEGGFLLNAEVGLFAMKREQVYQSLFPFTQKKIEVDLIQIAPLALYNYISYDQLGIRADDNEVSFDEYTIILDMGTDNTTLLVTNGAKIWIRNVPIGGNHFTRALTKEMKLTFAKAEHLKINATKSPDPKAVFQALRPVFNDYVSEIQRSIGYFSSVNRQAKISKVLGVGNGFQLAGLQKFLQQNLQYEVERVETFQAAVGDAVMNAPLFQENVMSFVVPYGLALQALELTRIHTNLLPPEIANARKIREKKPWAVAAAATLLFSLATSAMGYAYVNSTVSADRFGESEKKVASLTSTASGYKTAYDGAKTTNTTLADQEKTLVKPLDPDPYWLELYKAITEALPRDQGQGKFETEETLKNRIKLNSITTTWYNDVGVWYAMVKANNADVHMSERDRKYPPTGPGYVVTMDGLHYHHEENNPTSGQGVRYVVETLLKDLQKWTVPNKVDPSQPPIPVGKLGISHATITNSLPTNYIDFYPSGRRPTGQPGQSPAQQGYLNRAFPTAPRQGPYPMGTNPMGTTTPMGEEGEKVQQIPETRFTVEFVWQPVPQEERLETRPEPDPNAPVPAPVALPNANSPGSPGNMGHGGP